MSEKLPIGAIAHEAGVKIPTIRYYEQIGLIAEPPRSEGNRRLYGTDAVQRLRFIRRARELGFDIDAIRILLSLQDRPEISCEAVDVIASERLAEIEDRITSLMALKGELQTMIGNCRHDRIAQCRVIEAIAG